VAHAHPRQRRHGGARQRKAAIMAAPGRGILLRQSKNHPEFKIFNEFKDLQKNEY